jgi:nucleoside-diphosphate-sugar epimerase
VRVFVTGGTGLVGSHTIERLVQAGHHAVAMARSERGWPLLQSLGASPVRGHVERPEDWAAADGADAIVHAAAIVTDPTGWERFRRINVEGTREAVRAAAASRARLVHVSSVAVYGRRPVAANGRRVTEDSPFGPIADGDFYARSKREAEAVLWDEAARHGVSVVAVRPCVIYGERERLFMARVLRLLRHGIAPLVGRGDNTLAMVYVGSVVEAIACALERPDVTGPFNTANDGGFTQREFFDIVAEASGHRVRLLRIPEPVAVAVGAGWHAASRMLHPRRYAGLGSSSGRFLGRDNPYDSGRAERDLGWRPRTDAKAALRRTVAWFLSQADPIRR